MPSKLQTHKVWMLLSKHQSKCHFAMIISLFQSCSFMNFRRYRKDTYNPHAYEAGWKDTIAMERLSSSPHVLSMYGNCGGSQLTKLATEGNLYAQIKNARSNGDKMSPKIKLRIGYHVAKAVADVHSIDGSVPSLVHNDLCCDQYLLVDGVYKLNDFHMSSMVYKTQAGDACREPPKGMNADVSTKVFFILFSSTRLNTFSA